MDTRQVNETIQAACEAIGNIEKGTTVPHLVMGEILKVQRNESQGIYYRLVSKLKNELNRNGIFLISEVKIGYSIARPGEEIGLCEGEALSGIKKISKATARAQHIPINEIADPVKRTNTIQGCQRLANLYGMLRAGFSREQLTAKAQQEERLG